MPLEEAQQFSATPGEIIILSSGEWDDYEHCGIYRVLKPLTAEVILQYSGRIPAFHYWDLSTLVDVLQDANLIEAIPYKEIHVGSHRSTTPKVRAAYPRQEPLLPHEDTP